MPYSPCVACSAALIALASPALAQSEPERSTVVVIAQKLGGPPPDSPERTPGGVDVVDAAAFADTLAVSLRDALAFSPGVYAQPRFGQEIRLSIRGSGLSRGFHMRGLLLFQDGVPTNLADNNGDFLEFDPQVFQRIEVYRGGNALRFGGSTLGGAINAVTPTGRTTPAVEARIDGGSFGTVRAKLAAGFATERGDAFLALTGDTSDGDRQHARRRSVRFTGNAGLRLREGLETRFYAAVNRIDQDLPGSLTRAAALATPQLSLPANILQDQERNIDSIRLQNRTTLDLAGGTLTAGVFLNDRALFHPIFQVIDQLSLDYGGHARLDIGGTLVGVPVETTIGSTARFGHVAAKQFVNVAGERGALTADARQEAWTIDSHAELRARMTPALSIIAGGIHTHGRRSVANRLASERSGAAEFNSFAPKFGLLFEPGSDVQVYANANRSVELPGFSELNQTPFAQAGVVTPGFVDLDVQRAWTFEAGTRGSLGAAAWDITLYRADIRGELLQFNRAPDVPAATFNAGRTRHQGIEAALDLQLAAWLSLRQAYQLNDFRFRGDAQFGNNRLPVIARHLYRAALTIGTARASVSPAIEWTPQGAWADYSNTTRTPGYALLGIGAQARLRERLTVFLDARNVTGARAIGDISATVRATPASVIYYPVERRAVYGGVRARF